MEVTDSSVCLEKDETTEEKVFLTYDENEKQEHEINRENAKLVFSPKFIPVYPELLKKGLTLTEALIFGFIDFYKSSAKTRFYFTNEQIATIVDCNPDTVNRAISRLRDLKLITTSTKIKGNGGKIRFVNDVFYPSEPTISTIHNRQNLPYNNNKINKNKINNTPQAEIVERWTKLYFSQTNQPYKTASKDYVLIATLLKNYGREAVISKIKLLFALCKQKRAWFTKGGMSDFTIEKLSSRWNNLTEEVRDGKQGVSDREVQELLKKRGWTETNPSNKKTSSG